MYHKHHESKLKYGVAINRPQDQDRDLMITARRTNYGIHPSIPKEYLASNISFGARISLTPYQLRPTPLRQIDWICEKEPLVSVLEKTRSEAFVGVDLEFHTFDTYDGFTCVTSLAVGENTYVIDCLDNRRNAVLAMKDVLENQDLLKVFCGCDNDVLRIKKDWSIFPVTVIDVQDMFFVWKGKSFSDCSDACLEAIQKMSWKNSQTRIDKIQAAQKLRDYDKPSLAFLTSALLPYNCVKSEVDTHADYRKRPLHLDLIKYAGLDAKWTLEIFKVLAKKIGKEGIQQAFSLTSKKLVSIPRPAVYRCLKSDSNEALENAVTDWLQYLCKNLDKSPYIMISKRSYHTLVDELKTKAAFYQSEKNLSDLLSKLRLQDNCDKSARLLLAYLDPAHVQLNKMKDIICRRCNTKGHTAFFCITLLSPECQSQAKRDFKLREENRTFNLNQSTRRWIKYCQNRNLNPNTSTPPWKK